MAPMDKKWNMPQHFKGCVPSQRTFDPYVQPPPARDAHCRIAVVSSYPPRMCGIAQYSLHLVDALRRVCGIKYTPHEAAVNRPLDAPTVDVVAVRHKDHDIEEYPNHTVVSSIREHEQNDYVEAAHFLNERQYGVVIVQHEFGLMPGAGALCLTMNLKTRSLLVYHTVEEYMGDDQHATLILGMLTSSRLVVLTEAMRYGLDVWHAVPPRPLA